MLELRGRPKAVVLLSAENRNRKSIVSGPKPSASLMPACQGLQTTVPDYADVDSAASFLGYLYIVSQYTVRLMTPCVWRILCLRNSSCIPYFRQPSNLPTNCSRPKPKVHRMWYDCFRPKQNVRRKCPFVYIRRRNRSRNSVDLY